MKRSSIAAALLVLAIFGRVAIAQTPEVATPVRPAADDYTLASLQRYQQELLARYGGDSRNIPLDVKAEYFAWELWHYHVTEFHQVYFRVGLPDSPGVRTTSYPDRDSSTWNGAVLSALSYEYAATHNPATLAKIAELIEGLHLFFEVTGQPGLPSRAVSRADGVVEPTMRPHAYTAANGTQYFYEPDAAKGGYNQLAGGYAHLFMFAYADLPPAVQRRARDDATALVLHLVDHDFHATAADGRRTSYGDLTPLIGTVGVPFNAQVAYEIVALGHFFPPDDPAQRARIKAAFDRLRQQHHCYYEDPWKLVQPQRVGASPLLKGMNDRNHVTNAAFVGLLTDLNTARQPGVEIDRGFVHQLGQTMVHSMSHPDMGRHALCQFMWAVMCRDRRVFDCIVTHDQQQTLERLNRGLAAGVEQLRRFPIERYWYPGETFESRELLWNDECRLSDTCWKDDPHLGFRRTGGSNNQAYPAMDYLYAYWLFRYFRLDRHPAVAGLKLSVLEPTQGLYTPVENDSK